jgi:hypothetical protein
MEGPLYILLISSQSINKHGHHRQFLFLNWYVYKGGKWHIIASGGDVTDSSKYSVSTNPSGQYYILQILNVGVSDVKKYKCEAVINGDVQSFYLQLNLIGRCNYTLGIFKVEDRENCLIW